MNRPEENSKVVTKDETWSRRYKIGPYEDVYESKFATGEIEFSFDDVREQWISWDGMQRLEFVRAYSGKQKVTDDDEKIIEFLVGQNDARLCEMLAFLVRMHPNREWALEFLLKHAQAARLERGNFLQALAMLGDKRALPTIEEFYKVDLEQVSARPHDVTPQLARDFVLSCEALTMLSKTDDHQRAWDALQHHENESIRSFALLRDKIRSSSKVSDRQ